MADRECVGRESLELLGIFIGELEMVRVHRVLLEANSESVQDCIIGLELNLIGLLLEAECLLDINLWFTFDHLNIYQFMNYNLI